jgi:hypothetical protein
MAGGGTVWRLLAGLPAALAVGALMGILLFRRRPPAARAPGPGPVEPDPDVVVYTVPPLAATSPPREAPAERPRPEAPRDPGRGWAAFAFYLLMLPGILWVVSIAALLVLRAANVLKNDESGLLYLPLFLFVIPAATWSFPWWLVTFPLVSVHPAAGWVGFAVGPVINAFIVKRIAARHGWWKRPDREEARSPSAGAEEARRPAWQRIAMGLALLAVLVAVVLGIGWAVREERAYERDLAAKPGPARHEGVVLCVPLELRREQGLPAVRVTVRVYTAGRYRLVATGEDGRRTMLADTLEARWTTGLCRPWLRLRPAGDFSRAARVTAWPVRVREVRVVRLDPPAPGALPTKPCVLRADTAWTIEGPQRR